MKYLLAILLMVGVCLVGYSEANAMEYKYQDWWKSPKGQPYFDSVLHVNDTGKDLICSVCGSVVKPIHNKPGRGIYTNKEILRLNPDQVEALKYEVKV